jgi:membrane protein DedA with SNARE-associated domain
VEQTLLTWLLRYGAPVLFFAQVFGIVGLPVPDELLLTVAGALIRRGLLHPTATFLAAVGGCLSGITVSYTLGRLIGLPVLLKRLHLPEHGVARAQRWFHRFGGWLLTFGYFIPGVRHVSAIAAGSTPLDYPVFAKFAYPGGIAWCSVFLSVGYIAGDRWRQVADDARGHARLAALGLGVLVIAFVLIKKRRARAAADTSR